MGENNGSGAVLVAIAWLIAESMHPPVDAERYLSPRAKVNAAISITTVAANGRSGSGTSRE
jgi:hypothetical protein